MSKSLKYGIDMLTIELQLNKKDSENNKQWMNRISKEIYDAFYGCSDLELLRDTNIFENTGIYLFNTLTTLAKKEGNTKVVEELNDLFDLYRNRRFHTQFQTVKLYDKIMTPGKQSEVRLILLNCFKILQDYVRFYAEKGYLPMYDVLTNWVDNVHSHHDYINTKPKLRVSLSNPEELKKYSNIKRINKSIPFCNQKCIMDGNPVLCTREEGHEGVHVARLPIIGVIGVWE